MNYDCIVVGGGASGMIASIIAARKNNKVLLLEKLPKIGVKLQSTGGGKCNLTNTLPIEQFITYFGKNGRFIKDVIEDFNSDDLIKFFSEIGVKTDAKDGFRVFPISHNSDTIIDALNKEIQRLNIDLLCSQKVIKLLVENKYIIGVKTKDSLFYSKYVVIATGGLGFPQLGSSKDGYDLVKDVGHTITKLYPAMLPLKTKESWVKNCKANTLPKVTIKIDIKKYSKLKAVGDLIFTSDGIRGPVVLDFAREITPLFDKYDEVPIIINITKNMNEEQIVSYFKNKILQTKDDNILNIVSSLLPIELSKEILSLVDINYDEKYKQLKGDKKNKLIKYLIWLPLTIVNNHNFNKAMVTRGGVSLKQIDPKTMESKIVKNLFLCGEVLDIDGACGGFNLQWAFSSGYVCVKNINKKGKFC